MTENYRNAFNRYVKHNKPGEMDILEQGYTAFGEFLVPHGFENDYRQTLESENLFRRYARIIPSPAEGTITLFENTSEPEIISENGSYPDCEGEMKRFKFKVSKLGLTDKVHTDVLSDEILDSESYINDNIARRIGRIEERLCLNGTGINEPTGILTAAENKLTTATADITLDDIIRLYFSLAGKYRKNAVWVMSDETALKLRTAKTTDGDYLWNTNDNTLLGKPVEVSEFMPSAVPGSKPVVFGDLAQYWMLEHQMLAVKRLNEKYILEDCIGFQASERLDCKLIHPDAVKTLTVS